MNSVKRYSEVSLASVVIAVAIGCFVIFYGCQLNGNQHKYSKYHSPDCRRGIFIHEVFDSQVCCEDIYYQTDWACVAAYDRVNKVWSSYLAWIVPLLPIATTILLDYFRGHLHESKHTHLKRGFGYFMLFVYRTVSLIIFPDISK